MLKKGIKVYKRSNNVNTIQPSCCINANIWYIMIIYYLTPKEKELAA
jgi:hypothetical protein